MLADGVPHLRVRPEREEAGRRMVVVGDEALLAAVAAVHADVQQAARTQHLAKAGQHAAEVRGRDVQQAVERVHGVEGGGREVQPQEVGDARVQSLGAAALDHRGGQVRADDPQALPLEEQRVLAGARADLQQRPRPLPEEQAQEAVALPQLPALLLDRVAELGAGVVVGEEQVLRHLPVPGQLAAGHRRSDARRMAASSSGPMGRGQQASSRVCFIVPSTSAGMSASP